MNENFKHYFSAANMSMYELAAKSGLPYTTINKLVNDKMDINNLSSGCLYKISILLQTKMEKLLNETIILENASGRSGNVKYRWIFENNQTKIIFNYKGENVIIEMGKGFNDPKAREYYDMFAQMAVEKYMKEKAFDIKSDAILKGDKM